MDVHTPARRSYNMSRIRGRDTKPEMLIRKGLHSRGHRYRLHVRDLPGRPDLVFPGRRAVIFVHGCFWHGHDCPMFRLPATRTAFWEAKVKANRLRDAATVSSLAAAGWRCLTVWECALRGPGRRGPEHVLADCERFLEGAAAFDEIAGDWAKD